MAPVKGYNFAPLMFLLEIENQCSIASKSYEKLKNSVPGWRKTASQKDIEDRLAPIEIVMYSSAFLSAAAIIGKILTPRGRGQKIVNRTKNLCTLLEIDEIPVISNFSVRNSFEHIDEKLDSFLENYQGNQWSPISVHEDKPDSSIFVLKRLDPLDLTIEFARDKIEIESLMTEIKIVHQKIDKAIEKLKGDMVEVWT